MSDILVIGTGGQLARALAETAGSRLLRRTSRAELDFDAPETLAARLDALLAADRPALVVNAAAYTAVDRAETEPEAAARANHTGPAALAAACARAGLPLVHVSTDYVFDGLKGAPYVETDPTRPSGVYGATKLAGEHAVAAACKQAIILRTAWVYAAHGRNFILTLLGAATRTRTLRVVADQFGCPTAAPDLAAAILGIADRLDDTGWSPAYAGVFHAAGTGGASWHGLATALFDAAAAHGVERPEIVPITTADWPTPVRRPPDSRLDCARLAETFALRLPPWQETLPKLVADILAPAGAATDQRAR